MAKAKGTTILGAVKFLRRRKAQARELLPESLHSYLEQRIVASQWYPARDLVELVRACASILGVPGERAMEEIGAFAAARHLEGVYADLAPGGRSHALGQRLWSSIFDSGTLELASQEPGCARYEITLGYPVRELCALTRGYIAETYRRTGATDVRVEHAACQCDGAPRCLVVIRWQPGEGAGG
jgi:hypothetical protein